MLDNQKKKRLEELEHLCTAWEHAMISNNADAIGRFMADDWVIVSQSGVIGRDDFLQLVASGDLVHETFEGETLAVREYGETAIVTGRVRNNGAYRSKPFTADEWTTDIFVRDDDRWACVHSHITTVKGFESCGAISMSIPTAHQVLMPYLMVEDADSFFDFAAAVFDAKLSHPKERPKHLDGHCELQIGSSTVMFARSGGQWKPRTADLFVYVDNADETYHRSLKQSATTVMEPANQTYGRSCGVTDPFGNTWWITSVTS